MEKYDIAIIGGGTVGSMIFLDAASRGFSCVLIEKDNVGAKTNNASLGLIQTGLNYLYKNRDFVKMNAIDARLLYHIFKDFLRRCQFVVPMFSDSQYPLWLWNAYLTAYDQFTKSNHPIHQLWLKKEIMAKEPLIKKVRGGTVFYEWITDPLLFSKITVEAALKMGGRLLEGMAASSAFFAKEKQGRKINYLEIKSSKNQIAQIHASVFINAAGPWAPIILSEVFCLSPFKTRLTKGVSIIVKKRFTDSAVVLFDDSKKYITILPLNEEKTLIGPTNSDIKIKDIARPYLDNLLKAEDQEIQELLNIANKYFNIHLNRSLVCDVKVGLRPQLAHLKVAPNDITHEFMILDHWLRDQIVNLITVFGGKLTNQVRMAKETVDLASLKLGQKKPWFLPFIKITNQGFMKNDYLAGLRFINLYKKNCALSYNDDVNRRARFKKIISIFYLMPYVVQGFLKMFWPKALPKLNFLKKNDCLRHREKIKN